MKDSGVSSPVINQDHLKAALHELFPYDDLQTNIRKVGNIVNPVSGKYLELDFHIPLFNLSFEFQDDYHYITTWYSQTSLKLIKQNDDLKREKVVRKKDTLIVVPYWWNGSADSLMATIQFYRPDLIDDKSTSPLIPLNPLPSQKVGQVPNVGELMLASFPHSSSFHLSISPKHSWWMGEKYDGVRVCWNAVTKALYTRSGGEILLPHNFYSFFPNGFIDCEIWFGRGLFLETQKIVQVDSQLLNFQFFRVIAFDVPPAEMNNIQFEKRFRILLKLLSPDHPFILNAGRVMCKTAKHLKESIREIINNSGEGLILRRPQSFYFHGRSSSLLKLKASRGDKEGIVVAVYKSGSVLIKLPDGKTLQVGSHSVDLPAPPIPGDIVTFSYENFSAQDMPVNPRIYQIRKDVSWDDVVRDSETEVAHPQELNETSTKPVGTKGKPSGFWTANNGKNAKKFLEGIARTHGLDPRSPSTWYSFKREWIEKETGGATILDQFKGGMVNIFLSLFPDIGLEETKFKIRNQYFQDVKNRRQWFDNFARKNGFDPHRAQNWYSMTTDRIHAEQGSKSVLHHHKNNFIKALVSLYPEIGLEEKKFSSTIVFYWDDPNHRKEFFLEFAEKDGFDPLLALNWYSITRADVCNSMKGARAVLNHYGNSLVQALTTVFPNIGLDPSKFVAVQKNYWANALNRRKMFEEFAKNLDFDPLIAENWYPVSYTRLKATKGIAVCLSYGGTRYKILSQLFPEVSFDEHKFENNYRHKRAS